MPKTNITGRIELALDRLDNIGGSVIIDEFDGGLNDTDSNEVIKDNEATIRQNWINSERGAITKVKGFTKKNSTLLASASVTGLFRMYMANGTKKLLAVCNGVLSYSDNDGTAFSGATGGTGLSTTVFNSGVNYNDLFFLNNTTDNLKKFTFSTNTMATPASVPTDACRIILKRSDRRLIALVNSVNGSTLGYSKIDPTGAAADDWSATNDAGTIAIDGAKSEALTGGMTFGAVDIIFKDYAAFRVWGYPAPQAVRIPGAPGCAAPQSVAQGDGLGFHLAHDEVYLYDGNKFIPISAPIQTILDNINPSYVQNAFGVYRDGYYWLFYTKSGDTVNKNCIIYDVSLSNPYIGKNVWFERAGLEMNCPVIFNGAGDDNEIYAVDSADTGFVYRLDFSAGGSDNGSNITAINQIKYFDMGYPHLVKRFKSIKIKYYLTVTRRGITASRGAWKRYTLINKRTRFSDEG